MSSGTRKVRRGCGGVNVAGALTALVALVLLAVAGHGPASAAQPPRGGRLVVAIAAEPPGLDPTASTSQEIARIVYHNVYEGLVRVDRDGQIAGALAERWVIDPGARRYTFFLRRDVRFHNGRPFTGADVVAALERAKDPSSGHTHPEYYADIASVEAPDPYRVEIELKRPNAELLFDLARPDSVIYPAELAASQRSRPVGTGPFEFAEWVRGSHVTLRRFEGYRDPSRPYLDEVTFRFMPDPNAQMAALLAGDIDVIGYNLTPENALRVQKAPGLKLIEGTTTTEVILAMNNARRPFDDVRVRQAMQYAVNRRELIDGAMLGFGVPIGSHMSPAERYYLDLSDSYPHEPGRARQLLSEAGYPRGFTATLSIPQPYEYARRAGEVIAQQLAKVGIHLRIEVVEWGVWLSRIFRGGDYDLTIIGHAEPFDIGIYANPGYYFHYDSPAFRELVEQARSTSDESRRRELYFAMQRRIAGDAVNVFLFTLPHLVALRADVQGWWPNQPIVAVDVTEVWRGSAR